MYTVMPKWRKMSYICCTADDFSLWRPIPIPNLMVSCTCCTCSEQVFFFFPADWIYFYFFWGRHHYTMTISVLLGRMGGAVWHYDGCELSSAISVLTQRSSRTSDVQVYPVIEKRCVRDHANRKKNIFTINTAWRSEEKVQSMYVFIYFSTHQCMTKWCCFGSAVTEVIALTQS